MRVAMSAIPPLQLREILIRNADPNRPQDWLDIVTVYLGAKRYYEARSILVSAIQRFPELQKSRAEIKRIDQLLADQMFDAAVTAQNAGQHQLADQILRGFQANTLTVETQLKIERRLELIATARKECEQIVAWLREDLSKVSDPTAQQDLAPVIDEVAAFINPDTRNRFADYVNLRQDATLSPDQRAAIGFAGWLYGAGIPEQNLSIVKSGYTARRLIADFISGRKRNEIGRAHV